jgi:hypothetical protein
MFAQRASKIHAVQREQDAVTASTRLRPVDWGLGPSPKALGAAGK